MSSTAIEVEDFGALCTCPEILTIQAHLNGVAVELRNSQISSSSIEAIVAIDPSEQLQKQVLLDFGIGATSWSTEGILRTTSQVDDKYKISIDLKRQRTTGVGEPRTDARWESAPLWPILGEVLNPFQFNRKIPFYLHNISMGGVAIEFASPLPVFVGLKLYARIVFPFAGTLETDLLVRAVDTSGAVVAHCEFGEFSEQHVEYISRYLLEHTTQYNLGDIKAEHLVFTTDDHRFEVFEVANSGRLELQIVIHREIVGTAYIELLETSTRELLISDLEIQNEFNHPNVIPTLVSYLIRCSKIHDCTRIRIATNQPTSLERYGFTTRPNEKNRVYELDTRMIERPRDLNLSNWNRLYSLAQKSNAAPKSLVARLLRLLARPLQALQQVTDHKPVSWERYAVHYDTMCKINPAYQQMIADFHNWITQQVGIDMIVELGGGTGNFTKIAAEELPAAQFIHIDRDVVMNRVATRKYRKSGLNNISILNSDIEDVSFADNSLDLAICVHTLYLLSDPQSILKKIHRWLKPGGYLYVVDVGRPINLTKWVLYVFCSSLSKRGIRRTVATFIEARQVMKQNKHIQQAQSDGIYWLHSMSEFKNALEASGFQVLENHDCYRTTSDYALCIKAQ